MTSSAFPEMPVKPDKFMNSFLILVGAYEQLDTLLGTLRPSVVLTSHFAVNFKRRPKSSQLRIKLLPTIQLLRRMQLPPAIQLLPVTHHPAIPPAV